MEFTPGQRILQESSSTRQLSEVNFTTGSSLLEFAWTGSTWNNISTPVSLLPLSTTNIGGNEFIEDYDKYEILQQYYRNRALDTPSLVTLAILYTVLIFIGAVGNGLVCLAVARQPKMRTSRNLFIINLAISDLLLCFFTIPFSLVEISTKSWPYGVAMCKLVLALEATSIFVSTLSITAIALDRYQVILHSMTTEQSHRMQKPQLFKLILIWITGILLALPLFLFRTVDSYYIGIKEIDPISFCIEKWPIQHGRGYYSIMSMLIQYCVPITIVTVVYSKLCIKLRSRTLRRTSTTQLPKLRTRLQRRARKTNMLLISIALIFCISWLPLNVLNIVADMYFPFTSDRSFRITFAVCHMAGMSSSCSNPFLYGWLNQNFRNEFEEIFMSVKQAFYHYCLRNQKKSFTRHRAPSLTMSPNHELINYQTRNNDNNTITDFRGVIGENGQDNHHNNIVITIEETNDHNHIHRANGNESTSDIGNEVNTTQIYLSTTTTFGAGGEESIVVSTNERSSNGGGARERSNNSHSSKFKRLSLTDSRKRHRKKEQIQLTSGANNLSLLNTNTNKRVVHLNENTTLPKSKQINLDCTAELPSSVCQVEQI